MTRSPPRCLVRSTLTTRQVHLDYVASLTDADLHGDPDQPVKIHPDIDVGPGGEGEDVLP